MQRTKDLGEPLQAAVERRGGDFGARGRSNRSKRDRSRYGGRSQEAS
jgi:hypothetical protein